MGKLVVIKGTDGSGKSTQFRFLYERVSKEVYAFKHIVFPRYSEPSSSLIRMYLGGEFGSNPSDVNAYAASTFYAVDRYASYKQDWGRESATGTTADIHEKDMKYLATCRETGRLAAKYYGWTVIDCVRDGAMRSISDIHEEIYGYVSAILK